jgi:hypothetical protein
MSIGFNLGFPSLDDVCSFSSQTSSVYQKQISLGSLTYTNNDSFVKSIKFSSLYGCNSIFLYFKNIRDAENFYQKIKNVPKESVQSRGPLIYQFADFIKISLRSFEKTYSVDLKLVVETINKLIIAEQPSFKTMVPEINGWIEEQDLFVIKPKREPIKGRNSITASSFNREILFDEVIKAHSLFQIPHELNNQVEKVESVAYKSLSDTLSSVTKPHPLDEFLYKLPSLATPFINWIARFKDGDGINEKTFMEGVQAFLEIANLNYSERKEFFGSEYRGLHYSNDFTNLWNSQNPYSPLDADMIANLAPQGTNQMTWEQILENDMKLLVYRGNKPSEALDQLIAGPAVIDCNMFCQLAILFGIRAMVGSTFNEVFGRAPLFITQRLYQEASLKEIEQGNPFFSFFTSKKISDNESFQLIIKHIPNIGKYQLKHAGGAANGQNCVVTPSGHHIFDPTAPKEKKFKLLEEEVFETLREAFNAPLSQNVFNRIALYKKMPEEINLTLGLTYAILSDYPRLLANTTYEKEVFLHKVKQKNTAEIFLDFKKLESWLLNITAKKDLKSSYKPISDSELILNNEFLKQIPIENRERMSFEYFKKETDVQKELYLLATSFCESVFNKKSIWLTISGNAGIGKTAAAVSCAKELISLGKSVLWISESMVNQWTSNSTSISEILGINKRLAELLKNNYDAVILDDDNIAGIAGSSLLEEVYKWYVANPGKAVLITSNVEVNFKNCFGHTLEGYHKPPFLAYDSESFKNQYSLELNGVSQRPAHSYAIHHLSSMDKLFALQKTPEGQNGRSIGVIVSKEAYESSLGKLFNEKEIEVIPAFPYDWYDKMGSEAFEKKLYNWCRTEAYSQLSPLQKKWTHSYEINEVINGCIMGRIECIGVQMNGFKTTHKNVIAIELLEESWIENKTIINQNGFKQLQLIIHHCFDHGRKKIVVINSTSFSDKELIEKMVQQLKDSEKERLTARIKDIFLGWS